MNTVHEPNSTGCQPLSSNPEVAPESWQDALKRAVRDPVELGQLLDLPKSWVDGAIRAADGFGLFAPRSFIARMRPRDPHDPLLRQVLPLTDELHQVPGYSTDPLAEIPLNDGTQGDANGLIRKYAARALMVTTGACAVHCRYCFRRHYPYAVTPKSLAAWEPALDELRRDQSLREVLLSGGDPLVLTDDYLSSLAGRLAEIPHLRRLRVHTRLPVMIPQRVTANLVAWLRGSRLTSTLVIHANHPAELTNEVSQAVGRLIDAGVPVFNQSVLLRGVNDNADVLVELCERLIDARVAPYYLHQLDPVAGAAHFAVPVSKGQELIAAIRGRLPGYAVPRYVQETPGAAHKEILA